MKVRLTVPVRWRDFHRNILAASVSQSGSVIMAKFEIDTLPICFVLLVMILAGCAETGPELAPVTGRITLDGEPLEKADILFQPDGSKPPSSGRADAAGRYQLAYKRGLMGGSVGPNTVRITISPDVVANPPNIPARYNTESELTREVESGQNEFNFDLTANEELSSELE
jgi:hypothetical protein